MHAPKLRLALAGLALAGLTSATGAQAPPAPPAKPAPKVIAWPGGWMMLDGPEMILRSKTADGKSLNLVTGSGNGFGNRIVVDGGPGSVTVVRNSRNGIGNRIVVGPDDAVIDVDALLAELLPPEAKRAVPKPVAPPSYKGKDKAFWTKKAFSEAHDCNLYWDPTTKLWFRYHADEDTYRPVPNQPAAPPDDK